MPMSPHACDDFYDGGKHCTEPPEIACAICGDDVAIDDFGQPDLTCEECEEPLCKECATDGLCPACSLDRYPRKIVIYQPKPRRIIVERRTPPLKRTFTTMRDACAFVNEQPTFEVDEEAAMEALDQFVSALIRAHQRGHHD